MVRRHILPDCWSKYVGVDEVVFVSVICVEDLCESNNFDLLRII